jgi:hypothetical protein
VVGWYERLKGGLLGSGRVFRESEVEHSSCDNYPKAGMAEERCAIPAPVWATINGQGENRKSRFKGSSASMPGWLNLRDAYLTSYVRTMQVVYVTGSEGLVKEKQKQK